MPLAADLNFTVQDAGRPAQAGPYFHGFDPAFFRLSAARDAIAACSTDHGRT
jgi:hypothetical protein